MTGPVADPEHIGCRWCHAQPLESCRTLGGHLCNPHHVRVMEAILGSESSAAVERIAGILHEAAKRQAVLDAKKADAARAARLKLGPLPPDDDK